MKTIKKLFLAVMAALTLIMGGCSGDDIEKEIEVPVEKSKACELKTFKLVLSEGVELDGTVYDFDKSVEVVYKSTQVELLKDAIAKITVSDNATISPDPSVARDYSENKVKYTVTAEDGKTSAEYTIYMEELYVKVEHVFEQLWEKVTPNDIVLPADKLNDCGIAISGKHFVLYDGKVYTRDGQSAGSLNMTGMPSEKILSLTNDNNGVLLVGIEEKGAEKPFQAWIYRNGWNAAPELFLESTSNITKFMSVSGDMATTANYTAMIGGGATGPHFCFFTTDGWANRQYIAAGTNLPSNDGSWSQMISGVSGSVEDWFFVYDSEPGKSRGYVMQGPKREAGELPTARKGPGCWYPNIGGDDGWGVYTRGTVRGFTFDGEPYAIIGSSAWSANYFTICDPEPIHEPNLFIQTDGKEVTPSSAYAYDAEENCGYIYLLTQNKSVICCKVSRKETVSE